MRTVLIMFVAVVAVLAGKVFLSTGISHGHPIPQETLFKMSPSEMCLRENTEVCVGLTAVPYMGTFHWSIVSVGPNGWSIQSWYPSRWAGMKAPVEFLLSFISPVGVPGTVRFDDPILRKNTKGDIILVETKPTTEDDWLDVKHMALNATAYSPYTTNCAWYSQTLFEHL